MMHLKDLLAFLDACLDRLAAVVSLEPARQVG
jgi:hypothetical protein